MTTENQTPAPAASRVTIDDVRTVLEGTDPNATNASKVRALLGGRGSFETIQKHLSILRQELATAATPPVAADQVPALPVEAAQQMWVAAWGAAQVQTLRRTERLAAERDAALLKLETMGQDVAGLVATVDEQAGQIDQAAQAVAAIQAAHLADQAGAAAQASELAKELERTRAELASARAEIERMTAAAAAAQALAQREAQIERQALQTALERQIDKYTELKGVVDHLRPLASN